MRACCFRIGSCRRDNPPGRRHRPELLLRVGRLVRAERGRRSTSRTPTGLRRQGRAQRGRRLPSRNSYWDRSKASRSEAVDQPKSAGLTERMRGLPAGNSASGSMGSTCRAAACGSLPDFRRLHGPGMPTRPAVPYGCALQRAIACRRFADRPRATTTRWPRRQPSLATPTCSRRLGTPAALGQACGFRLIDGPAPRGLAATVVRESDSVIDVLAPLGLAL
jgi:hypothetical protein